MAGADIDLLVSTLSGKGPHRQEPADRAVVSLNAVTRLEGGKVNSRMSALTAVHNVLTTGRVEFLLEVGWMKGFG